MFLSIFPTAISTVSLAAIFPLVFFPYFILASSREKLYTSPPHFSCLLYRTQGYVPSATLLSSRHNQDLLAAFHVGDTSRVADFVRKLHDRRLAVYLFTCVTCKQQEELEAFFYA